MKNVEEIYESKKLVGLVIRHSVKIKDRNFFTDPVNPFQVAIHNTKTKRELALHSHLVKKPLKILEIQEFLYVQKGSITVTFVSKTGQPLAKKILKKNDSILIMNVSHKVDFAIKTQVMEIKQGPYQK